LWDAWGRGNIPALSLLRAERRGRGTRSDFRGRDFWCHGRKQIPFDFAQGRPSRLTPIRNDNGIGSWAARREAVPSPFKARPFYDYKTCPLRPGTSGDARGYIVWRGDAWKLCGGGKGLPRLRSGFRRAARTPRKRLNFDFAGRFVPNRPATLRMTVGRAGTFGMRRS